MRINIYSQELITDECGEEYTVQTFEKTSNTGLIYSAVAMFLEISSRLHHPPEDDDRSAIVLWLPKSAGRRERVARTLELMAAKVRAAKPETGLD